MDDLTALVTCAQADDDRAYGELVRRFQDMAYGYAYAILGDFHLAGCGVAPQLSGLERFLP